VSQSNPTELTVSNRTLARLAAAVLAVLVVIWVIRSASSVFIWLALALFLAIALDPVVRLIQRRGTSRGMAVASVVVTLLAVFAGFGYLIAQPLVMQVGELADKLPEYVADVTNSKEFENLDDEANVKDRASSFAENSAGTAGEWATTALATLLGGIFAAVTIFILTVLALLSGPSLVRTTMATFPELARRRSWMVIEATYVNISRYVGGTLVVALIGGLVSFVAMLILDIPHPLPLALWIALTAIVPIIGAFVGAIPAIIVATADEWWKGLALLIFMTLYQQLEGGVISANILGRAVKVPPLFVFVSILFGYQLLGIVGVLIAVPLTGTATIVLSEYREQKAKDKPRQVAKAVGKVDGAA
jgi:predicted PurR-regulated permease PerM